jgi:hypothetical protein
VFQPVHESFGVLIADLELDERPGLGLSCVNVTDIRSRDLDRREGDVIENSSDAQALRDEGPNYDHGHEYLREQRAQYDPSLFVKGFRELCRARRGWPVDGGGLAS